MAQYGNEWIQFNQEYYRVPVAEDGLYRITFNDLQQAGFPVGSVDPRRLQLFHRGVEQSIYVEGEGDGQFNSSDYVEFFGRKNDGLSDTELYKPASAQPHTYYNLYSDTTVYFLTSNLAGSGKRIQKTWKANLSGLPLEASHTNENLLVLAQEHSNGTAYSTYIRNTFFDVGEARTGQFVTQNNVIDYTLDGLLNGVPASGAPQIEVLVTGRSNVESNHRAEIYVGATAGSLRLVATQEVLQFNFAKIFQSINWTDIGGDGKMVVRLRVLATGASARASISYIKVNYPQDFDSGGSTEKHFRLPENPSGESFITIQNPSANARLFDITNPSDAIWYDSPTSSFDPVISNTDVSRRLFLTSVVRPVSGIKKVSFRNISPSQHDYLIISHPLLMAPAGGHSNVVKAFSDYRASEAGGEYDTLMVDVHQLYNQFNYGEISPMAIHRFMKYMVDGGSPKYLFIIGKGLDWFHNYHRNPGAPEFSIYKDLVPSAGTPASDMYYTIGLGGTTYEPAVPTGRISATDPGQVAAYLNKVKEMEALPFDDLWRKRILHLSGGLNDQEISNFKRYLQEYATVAEDIFLGGTVRAKVRTSTTIGEVINISEEVNNGVNLITFFGHSSATTSEFEVGFVSNPSHGYNNPGKYPMFLINGCNAGEFFGRELRYGEDWILAANKGATGFIAHSSFGFTSTLRYYSDIFYRLAYGDSLFMSKGVGDIQKETARRYMTYLDPSEGNLTQISQMVLLGDPALSLFGATRPDYEINNTNVAAISLDGEPITAYSKSFALQLIIQNFGRAYRDSVNVRVTRTFHDGSTEVYDSLFAPVFSQNTVSFILHQERNKAFGTNTFLIEIDPDDASSELNESNNVAEYELFVPLNLTKNLLPHDNAIVNTPSVDLIFSSTDILGVARDFELEIDTTSTFDSPFVINFTINAVVVEKPVDLLTKDSLVYYWRTRFKDPQFGEVDEWATSSFVFISDGPEGWAQLDFPQYIKNSVSGLVRDPELKLIGYEESMLNVFVQTFGSNHPLPHTNVSVKINSEEYNPNDVATKCRNNTINLIAFSKQSTVPYTGIDFNPFVGRSCGKRPQIINSFTAGELSANIPVYMQNIPAGDSVVLFTIGNPNVSGWTAAVKTQFEALGISTAQLNSIQTGEPVVIFAKKGAALGSAKIFRPIPSDTILVNEQEVLVNGTITGRFYSGSMTSSRIGPAQNWEMFIAQALISETPQTDEYGFDITGISLSGETQLLLSNVSQTTDLSFIDAADFPYLHITYNTRDTINLTPPQLNKWLVLYTPVAEGVLFFDKPSEDPIVDEGENWTGSFEFKNISTKNFSDSLTVRYSVFNQQNRTSDIQNFKIKAPTSGESTPFDVTLSTLGKAGLNDVEVYVNPNILPEQYYDNNQARLFNYLLVEADQFNPVLEVTVDGRQLASGDLVSPNPKILIRVWDNSFTKITSPDGISIRLRYPGSTFATEITFDRSDVQWFPQTEEEFFRVEFNPVNLPEGNYLLEVEARDANNNSSGTEPYSVEFEVSYETKVVLLPPYPNPSTAQFRFDFLISGQTPPDNLVFQVISLTGIVVQSLEATEFFIGTNHITWNGDEYDGNDVPSGLYIYQITFYKDGQEVPIALPEGESFLKGGYGKFVLSR